MRSIRFRERTWRYYRNWLITALVYVLFLGAIFRLLQSLSHLIWALPLYFVGVTILQTYHVTHPRIRVPLRPISPEDAGLAYEIVEFPSRDGLMLFGWYIPGSNGAAVILVHGLGGNGIGMIYHAVALASRGFGVLMFDLRAHGRSDGDICTMGWLETNDLMGAVDYLQRQEEVDTGRIGVLGISLGAMVALRTAAQCETIRGVVAEGPSPTVLADHGGRPTTLQRWMNYPFNWLGYKLQAFMSGAQPPAEGILAGMKYISPRPVLLIAAGKKREPYWACLFYEAALEPKEVWEIPEAKHASAFFAQPEAYSAKIGQFFSAVLLQ